MVLDGEPGRWYRPAIVRPIGLNGENGGIGDRGQIVISSYFRLPSPISSP